LMRRCSPPPSQPRRPQRHRRCHRCSGSEAVCSFSRFSRFSSFFTLFQDFQDFIYSRHWNIPKTFTRHFVTFPEFSRHFISYTIFCQISIHNHYWILITFCLYFCLKFTSYLLVCIIVNLYAFANKNIHSMREVLGSIPGASILFFLIEILFELLLFSCENLHKKILTSIKSYGCEIIPYRPFGCGNVKIGVPYHPVQLFSIPVPSRLSASTDSLTCRCSFWKIIRKGWQSTGIKLNFLFLTFSTCYL
jgi:hypothetical protein